MSAVDSPDGLVAIIILTFNQRARTLRCLTSFRDVERPPYKVVLWDNGSQDGTIEAVREAFPGVLAHYHSENIGVASGRNAAAALAVEQLNPSHLLFIDNDMTVSAGFLEPLLTPFTGDPRVAQTTGKIKDLNDPRRLYLAGGCRIRFWLGDTKAIGYGHIDRGQYDEPGRCIPSGGGTMVRSDVFMRLGGFDPAFDPYGPEDLDFALRVIEAGYYGLYVPQAVMFHETRPGRTFEGGQYTERYASRRAQHWFMFLRRHAPLSQQLGFLFLGAPYLLAVLMLREKRKGNLLPALSGLFRGFWHWLLAELRSPRGH